MTLENLRSEIDSLDYKILDLLNQRAEIALRVGATKYAQEGISTNFYHPDREQKVLEHISGYNQGPLTHLAAQRIFRSIMGECRQLQYQIYLPKQNCKIGVMGVQGAFSEIASLEFVKQNNLNAYQLEFLVNSDNVAREVELGTVQLGVVAIYNTIGGMVDETLNALAKYRCQIVDKIAIEIKQNLLVLPSVKASAIKTIHSHPQALKQAQNFLQAQFPQAEIIIEADTAEAAKKLSAGILPKTAAVVASERAAEIYGLEILATGVQGEQENITQFLVLKAQE